MNAIIHNFQAEQVLPPDRSILAHQGIPADVKVSGRTEALLNDARQSFLDLAKVSAVTRSVSVDQFSRIYEGEGRNQADDPLGDIYDHGTDLFLFAATVGQPVSDEIKRLMDGGELAEGCLLDSVASEAADRAAALIQNELARPILEESRSDNNGVMRFSPGYCGWHISGQKKLFEALEPDCIGMSLNERYLMQPLKSISGVIVIAGKSDFQFETGFPFCPDCRDLSCQARYEEMLTHKLD